MWPRCMATLLDKITNRSTPLSVCNLAASFLLLFTHFILVESISYKPESVSTCGLRSTNITCVGSPVRDDPFYQIYHRDHDSSNLAQFCAVYQGIACGRTYDNEGEYHELFYLYAPYPTQAARPHPRAQWRYNPPPAGYHYDEFPSTTIADLCFTKCRCSDRASRRKASLNPRRRRLPSIRPDESIAPLMIGFDHVEDVYYQAITPRPLVYGEEVDEAALFQRDLVSQQVGSPYLAAYWGNYLDARDLPTEDEDRAIEANVLRDDFDSRLILNTVNRLALKATANRDNPNKPQVLYASGQHRNQPRCRPEPIPEAVADRFELPDMRLKYDGAKDFCPHRIYGGNKTTNLGGICLLNPDNPQERTLEFPDRTRHPIFSEDVADESLAQTSLIATLFAYCRWACRCPTDPDYETNTEKVPGEIEALTGGDGVEVPQGRYRPSHMTIFNEIANPSRKPPYGRFDGAPPCSVMGRACTGPRSQGGCGEGCQCHALAEMVDPRRPSLPLFTAVCMGLGRATLGNLFPRDVPGRPVCPCNTTYVSESCCGSGDGLVWEPAEMKLGELRV